MRTQQEIQDAITACEKENARLMQLATDMYAVPRHERDPEYSGERNVDVSRCNNVAIATLKWLLGGCPTRDVVWRLPYPTPAPTATAETAV